MKQHSHFVTDWLDKRAKLTPERVGIDRLPDRGGNDIP